MSDSTSPVLYAAADGVATITVNRPDSLNSLNQAARRGLIDCVARAEADEAVRVVILTGEGRGFGAGADLAEGLRGFDRVSDLIEAEYKPSLVAIAESAKLYISAVRGPAAGISAAYALTCDLSVMAEDSYLYLAFANIALIPDGGLNWHLLHNLGYKRACEIVVEGQKIPAARCLALGLTNRVVPGGEVADEARQWAGRLAAGAPLAQRYAKHVLRRSYQLDLPEAISLEAQCQNRTFDTEDLKEGVEAFFARRSPRFRGR